jgi:group I intron endonuclease
MIGIYKITSPSGKIYIGQSIDIAKRMNQYAKMHNCKHQVKLLRSLTKYGFSEHIFKVVEECNVDQLNVRERHWQDFYDVLGVNGLNCKLTNTNDKSGSYSQEAKDNISKSLKELYKTPEGREVRSRQTANRDKVERARKTVQNTDYVARSASYDWTSLHKKRVANTDYTAIAKKRWVEILQFNIDGTLLREWPSIKEAGSHLKVQTNSISACCRSKRQTAGGFIWKYKNYKGDKEQD